MKAAILGMAVASLLVCFGGSAQAASCGAAADAVVDSTERGSEARKKAVANFKSEHPACIQAMNEALVDEDKKVADSGRRGGGGKGDDFILVPVVSGGSGGGSVSSH